MDGREKVWVGKEKIMKIISRWREKLISFFDMMILPYKFWQRLKFQLISFSFSTKVWVKTHNIFDILSQYICNNKFPSNPPSSEK